MYHSILIFIHSFIHSYTLSFILSHASSGVVPLFFGHVIAQTTTNAWRRSLTGARMSTLSMRWEDLVHSHSQYVDITCTILYCTHSLLELPVDVLVFCSCSYFAFYLMFVRICSFQHGYSALYYCCMNGSSIDIQTLIRRGADVNHKDRVSHTGYLNFMN